MSAFKTQLPVDLDAVKKLLPKDHNIEKVVFDPANNRLEVLWHTSAIETPYTFHVDFSLADLEAKKLPAHTKLAAPRVKPTVPSAPATVGKGVAPKPGPSPKPKKLKGAKAAELLESIEKG